MRYLRRASFVLATLLALWFTAALAMIAVPARRFHAASPLVRGALMGHCGQLG